MASDIACPSYLSSAETVTARGDMSCERPRECMLAYESVDDVGVSAGSRACWETQTGGRGDGMGGRRRYRTAISGRREIYPVRRRHEGAIRSLEAALVARRYWQQHNHDAPQT